MGRDSYHRQNKFCIFALDFGYINPIPLWVLSLLLAPLIIFIQTGNSAKDRTPLFAL
jgi:hypothetical protein